MAVVTTGGWEFDGPSDITKGETSWSLEGSHGAKSNSTYTLGQAALETVELHGYLKKTGTGTGTTRAEYWAEFVSIDFYIKSTVPEEKRDELVILYGTDATFKSYEKEINVPSTWTVTATDAGGNIPPISNPTRSITLGKVGADGTPMKAGKYSVKAEKNGKTSSMTLIIVEVEVILPQEKIYARSEGSPLERTSHILEVKTTPTGFEKDVELLKEEVTVIPDNADKGILERVDDCNWRYWALLEDQSDKCPGYDDLDKRYWDISFKYNIFGNEKDVNGKLKVFSVFKYLVDHNLQSGAIEYVVWKYNLSGCTIGSYLSGGVEDGEYGRTSGILFISISYRDLAFDSENILASTISHEDIHGDQLYYYVRQSGTFDKSYYDLSVSPPDIPEPPLLPRVKPYFGLDWANMECPAYDSEKAMKNDTGISDPSNLEYYDLMDQWHSFFKYIISIN